MLFLRLDTWFRFVGTEEHLFFLLCDWLGFIIYLILRVFLQTFLIDLYHQLGFNGETTTIFEVKENCQIVDVMKIGFDRSYTSILICSVRHLVMWNYFMFCPLDFDHCLLSITG